MNLQTGSMIAGIGLLMASASAYAGDIKAGRTIATTHCQRCHVIPGMSNMGIGSTPSFKAMVRSRAKDWRERFEAFYTLRPHPNFVRIKGIEPLNDLPAIVAPFELTPGDVNDLMAYVDELAAEYRK